MSEIRAKVEVCLRYYFRSALFFFLQLWSTIESWGPIAVYTYSVNLIMLLCVVTHDNDFESNSASDWELTIHTNEAETRVFAIRRNRF